MNKIPGMGIRACYIHSDFLELVWVIRMTEMIASGEACLEIRAPCLIKKKKEFNLENMPPLKYNWIMG